MLSVIPEDRSKDAWLAAAWKEWEACAPHPSTPPRIGPRRRHQGRISEWKTMDDSKQTTNWGQSLQIMGTGVQCRK